MKTDLFDFSLPEDLIAQTPVPERDRCRLMVLEKDGSVRHRLFWDIPEYFSEGDLLILNETKVFPASLTGRKKTGGLLEILLVKETGENEWEILSRGGYSGTVEFSENFSASVREGRFARFSCPGPLRDAVWSCGKMPLPPYIRRKAGEEDRGWYQTVYARNEGSIAAPTAGLHFTKGVLDELKARGVIIAGITLHVGTGTFRPLKADDVENHCMEMEYFEISRSVIEEIEKAKVSGKKVVATGTTTTRAIEGFYSGKAGVTSSNGTFSGHTDIFIYPGFEFRAVDRIITNFHLPKSTPLLLSSALAGRKKILSAYEDAIRLEYRFFSYGDAMLIL